MNALAHRITGVTRTPRRGLALPHLFLPPLAIPHPPRAVRTLGVAALGTAGVMIVLERVADRLG